MTLTVSNAGSGPLVRTTVIPCTKANHPWRCVFVQCETTAGERRVMTGPRLRSVNLMAVDSTSARDYIAGVKDVHDVWSEWCEPTELTAANYSAGATEASIGSGSTDELERQEPGVLFPDPSLGSTKGGMRRTLSSEGVWDEARRRKWYVTRATFSIDYRSLEEAEARLLHKFFRACKGPLKPFFFDFADGIAEVDRRYVVRFRDQELGDSMDTVDRSSMGFNLVELVGAAQGGPV
jgi:hypothetical protein